MCKNRHCMPLPVLCLSFFPFVFLITGVPVGFSRNFSRAVTLIIYWSLEVMLDILT